NAGRSSSRCWSAGAACTAGTSSWSSSSLLRRVRRTGVGDQLGHADLNGTALRTPFTLPVAVAPAVLTDVAKPRGQQRGGIGKPRPFTGPVRHVEEGGTGARRGEVTGLERFGGSVVTQVGGDI